MSKQMDGLYAIFDRIVNGEIGHDEGVNIALGALDKLSQNEKLEMMLELGQTLKKMGPKPKSPDTEILFDPKSTTPEELSTWEQTNPFVGFSMSINPVMFKNHRVQSIWDNYRDKPKLLSWNNPTVSMFYRDTDTIYLTDTKTIREVGYDANYRYGTLFHEMVHSTGIAKRLNRSTWAARGDQFIAGGREETLEEIIADVGGLMLMDVAKLLTPQAWNRINRHSLLYASKFLAIEHRNLMQVRREALPYAKEAVEYITGKPFIGRLGKFVRGSDESTMKVAA